MIPFKKPTISRSAVADLVVAGTDYESAAYERCRWPLEEWQKYEAKNRTAWRNFVAWYLRASGVPTARIAMFLGLSESRALAVARSAKNIAYRKSPSSGAHARARRMIERRAEASLSEGERAALRQIEAEDAEYFLSRSITADLFVVSAALMMGKDATEPIKTAQEPISASC